MERITIIGMGLIGTSLGLALKKSGLTNVEIIGHDREPNHNSTARKRGAVDNTYYTLASSVEGARIIIIATPVMAIRETLELIGPHLEPGTVVTDTGSTKSNVLEWAREYLPPEVEFVGGHPMAGKEESGPDAADGDLFKGAVYAICPGQGASNEATSVIVSLAEAVGAEPYFVDAAEHDSYVAAVSHLPFILSTTLVAATSKSPAWREMYKMAANGYRDISRLASGDPEMHRDICLTNRESIVHWVDEAITQLYDLRNLIRDDEQGLMKAFIDAWEARNQWMAGMSPAPAESELPRPSEGIMGFMLGERAARRLREMGGMEKKDDKTKYQRR